MHPSFKSRLLHGLLARRGATIARPIGAPARDDLKLVRRVRQLVPILIQDGAALQLLACVRSAAPHGGAMAEAGVFAGGTARLICEAKGDATLHLFDVFEGLQLPDHAIQASVRADELRALFGRVHSRRAVAERLLAPHAGVVFHVGLFPESATGVGGERFCFVHVDLDHEGSTLDALEFFHPRVVQGGIILGDDYHDPGVRRAFARFFVDRPETLVPTPWGQVIVVRA
jgi:hypothetical protein